MTQVRFSKRPPGAKQPALSRAWLAIAIAAGATLAIGTFAYRFLTYAGFPNDHFVHLATAQQMTMGELPVRDFVERGLPLMSLLSAAAQVLFGRGIQAELLLISAAFAAAAALTFVVAARMSGSLLLGFLAASASVLAFPATYGYPKMLAYALVFAVGWRYCAVGSGAAGLAATIVVAFLFRHDHGVLLAFGVCVMLVAYHGVTRAAALALGRFVLFGLLFVAPYLAWVQIYEGLDLYVREGVAFSEREAERSTFLALPGFAIDRSRPLFAKLVEGPIVNVRWDPALSDAQVAEGEARHRLLRRAEVGPRSWRYELTRWSASDVETLVRDPAVADTHGIDRSTFTLDAGAPEGLYALMAGRYGPAEGLHLRANGVSALFYLVWILPLAALAVIVRRWSAVPPAVRATALMAVAVQLAMNATMLRDPLDSRVRDVMIPASLLVAFLAGWLWTTGRSMPRQWLNRTAAVLLALLIVAVSAAAGPLNEHVVDIGVLRGRAGLVQRLADLRAEHASRWREPFSATGTAIVDYLTACTPPRARLFTMTFAPDLLFQTGRGFAAGHVTLTPGYYKTEHDAALMLDRLSREDVPFVIMDSETREEMRFHYPRVVAYVEGRYREAGRFPVGGGGKDFIVLAQSDRPVSRNFAQTELPCYDQEP